MVGKGLRAPAPLPGVCRIDPSVNKVPIGRQAAKNKLIGVAMRLVIVSFFILGWLFWEMSGGSEFEPRPAPERMAEAAPETAARPASDPEAASLDAGRPAARATPVAVSARPLTEPRPEADPQPAADDTADTGPDRAVEINATVRAALRQSLPAYMDIAANGYAPQAPAPAPQDRPEPDTLPAGATTGGLISTALPEEVAMAAAAPQLREITGTRVNMRNGPGTTFEIVERLVLGDELEMLSDPGNGWLRVRLVDTGTVGWVAQSLVSAPLN
jgi:hypothetical protein